MTTLSYPERFLRLFTEVKPGEAGVALIRHVEGERPVGNNIDVDFKVPQQVQVGYFQEFKDDWSFTMDAVWFDTSEFGIQRVNVSDNDVSFPAAATSIRSSRADCLRFAMRAFLGIHQCRKRLGPSDYVGQ